MHTGNPYRTPLDFLALAEFYPPLRPLQTFGTPLPKGKTSFDTLRRDPNQQYHRTLTQALLKRDFGLCLDLPEDRLCPPVPNRLNYILWIQDIVSSARPREIRGLDIGTGASVIYPLLACSLPGNSNWSFVATENDSLSIKYASRNIENNGLASRIVLYPVPTESESILAPLFTDPELCFDFTMCNPPFYGSTEEIETSAENKDFPPNAVCTGAENEMITPGGETAFVLKILRESCHDNIKHRCRWFTSMLGKLSSVEVIVCELRNLKIDNYALTQFVQGTTRRWSIAWSFGDERLPDKYSRPTAPSLLPFLPLPTTLQHQFTSNLSRTRSHLLQILSSIEGLSFTFTEQDDTIPGGESSSPSPGTLGMRRNAPANAETAGPNEADHIEWSCTVSPSENTWSRAARRLRKRVHHDTRTEQRDLEVNDDKTDTGHSEAQPIAKSIITRKQSDTDIHDPSPPNKESPRPILVCRISASAGLESISSRKNREDNKTIESSSSAISDGSTLLTAQWLRGVDRPTFEGFWSHVCRKLKAFE